MSSSRFQGLFRFIVAGVFATSTAASFAVDVSLDSRGTFLLNTQDTTYGYALDAFAVPLSLLGLSAGDAIFLQEIGDYQAGNGIRPDTGLPFADTSTSLIGVFSSSASLLDRSVLNRLPGALSSDAPAWITKVTTRGGVATDIAQDFDVFNGGLGVTLTIPTGANYIFFSANDTNFPDNTDPDLDYGVRITAVPEPTGLALTLGGLALLGFKARRKSRD